MSQSKFLTGSFCLNDVLDALKSGHSAFTRSEKNQKVYVSIKQWVKEEPDQFGNHASLLLNSSQTASAEEKAKKIYVGNLKIQATGGGSALSAEDAAALASSVNLSPAPGAAAPVSATIPPAPAAAAPANGDGLPF